MRSNLAAEIDPPDQCPPYVEISPSGYTDVHYISGKICTDGGFKKGHIGFQDGLVTEVGDGEVKDPIAKGLILPTFVNAHTHIADYVVPIDLSLSLADICETPRRSEI